MDDPGLSVLAATALLLVLLGAFEALSHRRKLVTIPIRVHVNGTRGKSSVTRLVAAGLRAGGRRVLAKTTGTLPRIIHPDGYEEAIYRVGRPNVIEQLEVVRRAWRLRAEALVVECMALEPLLQWVGAVHLIRPTHGIITNVRADHLEVMGPTTEQVARALAGSIPYRARLYTTPGPYLSVFERACRERHSECVVVDPTDEERISEEELGRLPYIEHADNVALALRVCRDLAVPREVALEGMRAARPDPGALTVSETRLDGRPLTFVNGFAANDPESTHTVWELALARCGAGKRPIALVNCRSDRPERSRQLGRAISGWSPAESYVIVGSGTHFFTSAAVKSGLDRTHIHVAEQEDARTILGRIAQLGADPILLVGLGNIGGVGLELLEVVRQKEQAEA